MKRKLLITGIVVGAFLTLGPAWGMLAAAIGMMGAFKVLGSNGISDPNAISHQIGITLMGTTLGLVACAIGVVLLVACIVGLINCKKQPPAIPTGI